MAHVRANVELVPVARRPPGAAPGRGAVGNCVTDGPAVCQSNLHVENQTISIIEAREVGAPN